MGQGKLNHLFNLFTLLILTFAKGSSTFPEQFLSLQSFHLPDRQTSSTRAQEAFTSLWEKVQSSLKYLFTYSHLNHINPLWRLSSTLAGFHFLLCVILVIGSIVEFVMKHITHISSCFFKSMENHFLQQIYGASTQVIAELYFPWGVSRWQALLHFNVRLIYSV